MPPKEEKIEIPLGAKDSELCEWEYTIPEGYEAEIKDGKVIVKKKEEPLPEFEDNLAAIIDSWCDGNGKVYGHLFGLKKDAGKLLELAFKSPEFKLALQKSWDEGNLIGYGAGQKSVEKDLPKWKNTIFAYKNPEVPKIETKCGPSYQLHYKGLWIDVDELFKKLPKE